MGKMDAGLAAVELTDAVTHGTEESGGLFVLLADTLAAIDGATQRPRNALYFFELRLLALLGVRPDFLQCARCGRILEEFRVLV
jgi:DNA repair protein RecO